MSFAALVISVLAAIGALWSAREARQSRRAAEAANARADRGDRDREAEAAAADRAREVDWLVRPIDVGTVRELCNTGRGAATGVRLPAWARPVDEQPQRDLHPGETVEFLVELDIHAAFPDTMLVRWDDDPAGREVPLPPGIQLF